MPLVTLCSLLPHGRRGSRRSWRLPACATAVLVLLAGCGVAEARTGSEGAGSTSSPAPVSCTAAPFTVLSPADGVVAAGPFTVVGTSGDLAGRSYIWELHGADGAQLSSGLAERVPNGVADQYRIPLDLAVGTYSLTVQAAGGPPTATAGCGQVARSLRVVDSATGRTWTSGGSGQTVADGSFADWRGSSVGIAVAWADTDAGQLALWPIRPGGDYASWTGDLDLAVGAIDRGESWARAAQGDYDDRWATSLKRMAQYWQGHTGTLYIRFAHEFNGNWYPWSVDAASVGDFITSWQRYRALQQQYFPAGQLVFAPNIETVGQPGLDWRAAFPGEQYVDVESTSYFNGFPNITGAGQFWQKALALDPAGAPRGIEGHRQFALSHAEPFAVSEWGADARLGDSPDYIEQMYSFFNTNAGTGPGQLRYEALYDVAGSDDVAGGDGVPSSTFLFEPSTAMPQAAEAYRRLW